MFMKQYAPNRCEPRIGALNFRGGGGWQGRCERRSVVFVKIHFFGGGGGGRGGGGIRVDVNGEVKFFFCCFFWGEGGRVGGGPDGCERRIEVFVKIRKKNAGGGGRGRVGDGGQARCERRREVCENSKKKGGGGCRVGGGGSGWM